MLTARMQSFSAWSASYNKNAYDLSDAGFFHTGVVLYKQNLFITRRNIFSKTPLIKIVFVTGEKDHTICSHCGVALKHWKVTDSAWWEHAILSPKCVHALHINGHTFVSFVAPRTK
jgi:hypothetical protein